MCVNHYLERCIWNEAILLWIIFQDRLIVPLSHHQPTESGNKSVTGEASNHLHHHYCLQQHPLNSTATIINNNSPFESEKSSSNNIIDNSIATATFSSQSIKRTEFNSRNFNCSALNDSSKYYALFSSIALNMIRKTSWLSDKSCSLWLQMNAIDFYRTFVTCVTWWVVTYLEIWMK